MRLIANPGLVDEQVFESDAPSVTIGRTPENTVYVLHRSLSRKHARLDFEPGRITLVDLQSKNGTFVNGNRVERAELRPGDTFSCGEVVFRLVPEAGEGQPDVGNVLPTLVHDPSSELSRMSIQDLLGDKTGDSAIRIRRSQVADRARDKLQILLKVSQLLSSPLPIDALLERILDLVFQILDVDRAAVLLRDEATGELRPRVKKSASGTTDGGSAYSRHIVNYVRDHSVAALFSDTRLDPRLDDAASIFAHSIRASMCAPLKPRDRLLGVLYVDNTSVGNRFREEDLEFLSAFANQAAIAIENSTLYKRIEEEAVLRNTYQRFFPPATLKKLELSRSASLEVIETEVTALFSDISNFTAMTSTMAPRQVVDMLNEYFPIMADIVFRHEGTLEKYIGDALMAVWGAPFSHPDDVDRAVRAAVEMQAALSDLNARFREGGKAEIQIHIGLNTGRVAAGNIGSSQYLQYATLGDATNVASRVCSAAQSGEILLAESTHAKLRERAWPLHALPPVKVKGKEEPLNLFRLDWQDGPTPRR